MKKELNKIISIIKKYDRIIITGHVNPDFDSFAASLGVYAICEKLKKETYIYINEDNINNTLKKGIEILQDTKETYKMLNLETVKNYIDIKTLLIVVDTCKSDLIESKELLNLDIIVIDHHIKGENPINSKYEIIDNKYSSASEILTKLLNIYKITPSKIISTLLLVGIEIDTNGYSFRTTEDTFKASSLLMRFGADNTIKNEVLKETREEYLSKMNLIKRSYMVKEHVILCVLDNNIYDQKDLAEVADELLQFENVKVSYVIGKIEDEKISISSRSTGETDVQEIMQQLGGGGSQTAAGAQFENSTIKEIKQELLNSI